MVGSNESSGGGPRRLLVVCTANVCRSPVAQRLLARALEGVGTGDGRGWVVTSAGTGRYSAGMDPGTVSAAAAVGVDLADHTSRTIDRSILGTDGADLVVTMTREHLRDVVALDPGAWPRTFTLKELARRAISIDAPTSDESFEDWRRRLGQGRQASAMLRPDPADDVSDPYGRPARFHTEMVTEVSQAIDQLVAAGPWTPRPPMP
ncbi:hypothetical protein [Desertimonas flava]|uniref:arsenate reductase/protein-tyrosine-phosphatase family protein n=1 Tax=Desertimonas flava TaxID=2064846 RepID=UPI000E34D143|nr:hypothetical protein [Desertimonas flava]